MRRKTPRKRKQVRSTNSSCSPANGPAKLGEGKDAHEATVTYKVTSGGSAVVETIGPGTEHEMVTVIHPDGDDLMLTHYCMPSAISRA